jgi:predicted SAM-dependent methyltransferase
MKLHLGCGRKRLEGWLNCDLQDSDMDMDIRTLPFEDGSIDEIMAIHVCEHFYIHEIMKVFKEWFRVLRSGGKMTVELPCLDNILNHFSMGSPNKFTLMGLYGDPGSHKHGEPALHKWCWSKAEFRKLLEKVGFKNIVEEEPKTHIPSRDMRFVCVK